MFEAVYEIVRRVPFGRVTTYGDVARALGNPRLSRAVGYAMHDAPQDVPCHRVVNRFGGLSDAFTPLGKQTHRDLLELEGVPFQLNGNVDLALCRWTPGEGEQRFRNMILTGSDRLQIYETHSETETERAGAAFAAALPGGTVVAMYGELGSGKTAFVRGMARGMGLDCRVSSPTFTIVNEYEGARELFHFDMYRLASGDELFDIGWEDYLARGAVCAVEWSENVEDAFCGDEIVVRFEKTGLTDRRIVIEGGTATC